MELLLQLIACLSLRACARKHHQVGPRQSLRQKFVCFVFSVLGCPNLLFALVVKCAAMHSSKDRHFSCPCLFVCESVVESPVQFLSAYFRVQSCMHFTNAVSESEGSIELVHILSKAGRQRQCAPCSSQHKFCQTVGSEFLPMGSKV